MTDARSAWLATGEQLTALGAKLGAHYEEQHAKDGDSDLTEDTYDKPASSQPEEAIKKLGEVARDAFEAAGTAARDEAVRSDVKQVGISLLGALEVTFREVSNEVRKVFDRPPTPPAPPAEPGHAPGPNSELD